LNVGEELRPLPHQEGPSPQQVPGFAHGLGVDVGLREHAAAQESRDLMGVDAIIF